MSITRSSLEIIGKLLLLAIFVIVLLFLLAIPVAIIGFIVEGIDVEDIEGSIEQLTSSSYMEQSMRYLQMVAMIGAVMIMYAIFERRKDLIMGWRQSHALNYGLVGSGWGILLISVSFLLIWVLGGLQVTGIYFDGGVVKGLVSGIILFIFVAVNEELVARGYIQGLVRRRFGVAVAIFITSIIFAALHLGNPNIFENPFSLINLFAVGILLGVTREATGGLWVPIGIHFTWNLFQGNVYGIQVSGIDIGNSVLTTEQKGNMFISGGQFGAEGSVITTIIIIIATVVWWRRYRDLPAQQNVAHDSAS